jgi:hypothetical protein
MIKLSINTMNTITSITQLTLIYPYNRLFDTKEMNTREDLNKSYFREDPKNRLKHKTLTY